MQARKVFLTILFLSMTVCSFVIAQSKPSENDYLLQRIGIDAKIIPYVGVAIPLGEFSKANYGAAKMGFSVGAQIIHNAQFGPLLHFSYSSNKPDYVVPAGESTADNWKNFLVLGGIKILSGKFAGIWSYYVSPLVGIIISEKAAIATADSFSGRSITAKAINTTFAWGLTAGISIRNLTLSAVFTCANNRYDSQKVWYSGGGEAELPETIKYEIILKQRTEILQINLGYAL